MHKLFYTFKLRFMLKMTNLFHFIECVGGGKLCLLVTGGHDHLVKLWNVTLAQSHHSNIRPLRVLSGHSESVMCVRISAAAGGLIASASGDKYIRLWEVYIQRIYPIFVKSHLQYCFFLNS
jgi:WD40 repeat protein